MRQTDYPMSGTIETLKTSNDRLRETNADLLAALTEITRLPRKSLLEACAYQGPPGKKWLREMKPIYDAHNEALESAQNIARAAIERAE